MALVWVAIAAVISAYTVGYGIEEWRNGNRLGAVSIFTLCVLGVALPVWYLYLF